MKTILEQAEVVTQARKGRPAITKSQAEVIYVRQELVKAMKEKQLGQYDVADMIGLNQSNVSKFLKKEGWTRLSDASVESIYAIGLVTRPSEKDLQQQETVKACEEPIVAAKMVVESVPPLENYMGEVITTSAVAKEKGRSVATIRNYCKKGLLNYTIRNKRYYVCVDEKLAALQETEVATLRKKVSELEKQVIDMQQLSFGWDEAQAKETERNLKIATEELEEINKDVAFLISKNNELEQENRGLREAIEKYQQTIERQASIDAERSAIDQTRKKNKAYHEAYFAGTGV